MSAWEECDVSETVEVRAMEWSPTAITPCGRGSGREDPDSRTDGRTGERGLLSDGEEVSPFS